MLNRVVSDVKEHLEQDLDFFIRGQAVLSAICIDWDSRRQVLGVEMASSRESAGCLSRRANFTTGKSAMGKCNEHNGLILRDFWLEDWEEMAIIDFYTSIPWRAMGD